jgi:hypothetical protein
MSVPPSTTVFQVIFYSTVAYNMKDEFRCSTKGSLLYSNPAALNAHLQYTIDWGRNQVELSCTYFESSEIWIIADSKFCLFRVTS